MRWQHGLTVSVHRNPVTSIQDSHVPTTFGICVKCNLIYCLLELDLIGTHGWRHHSMLEGCDKHFICGRKEKKHPRCTTIQTLVKLFLDCLLEAEIMLRENGFWLSSLGYPWSVYQLHGPLPKSFVETTKRRTAKATPLFLTIEVESCPSAYLHL